MSVKKYTAATMQKALKNIREDLGDDAIIVSNRKLPNGQVEITVSLDDAQSPQNTQSQSYDHIQSQVSESRAMTSTTQDSNRYNSSQAVEPLSLSNEKAKKLLAAVRTSQHVNLQSNAQPNAQSTQQLRVEQQAAPIYSSPDMVAFFQNTVLQLQQDISDLRRHVQNPPAHEQRLPVKLEQAHSRAVPPVASNVASNVSSNRRALALVSKKWRQIGLDEGILKAFYKTPAFKRLENETEQILWNGCLKHLKSLVPRYARNAVENPGVYAFVGPTGAGKTTTLGKLAVRQVNRWGAANVGIVTMDSFRIGAWEQMQRLGDIIGIKTALCRQEDSLMDTLSDMRDCKFILIDTAGLSHQDERRIAQWHKLDELGDELETYLVAQANLQSNVLQQLTQAYKPAHIRGMIFTKCDEVTSLGEAVSALVHAELPWVFACDGQRIPEDLKVMSVDAVMQMLATTAKQKRWNLGGHASEQETLLVKAMGE